ncbi:MAG: hypothetical protein SGJ20_22875 [Planctomycetota bacterium]|nr:hypothetical protein [Planctomycetota bacterium]
MNLFCVRFRIFPSDQISPYKAGSYHLSIGRTVWLFFLLIIAGCDEQGVPLTPVRGQVTLDGKPLPAAVVMFVPNGTSGGPAYGVTDSEGNYELRYSPGRAGAVTGNCLVRIKTGVQKMDENRNTVRTKELVPDKYNKLSTLRVEVGPDTKSYDFALSTQ